MGSPVLPLSPTHPIFLEQCALLLEAGNNLGESAEKSAAIFKKGVIQFIS